MTRPVLVVQLSDDLAPMERTLVFHALMQVHGVTSVTDLSQISEPTLRLIMREPPAPPPFRPRRARGSGQKMTPEMFVA